MKKVTIYGERHSGTTYLEELLLLNFDVEIVWDYGFKHFFGFDDLSNSGDVLFIGIIRNLEDWINSLYRVKHNFPPYLTKTVDTFLNDAFCTYLGEGDRSFEVMIDRHIETNERWKNIFELRMVKNKFLIEKMPKLVKKFCLITYDELCDNFIDIMNKFRDCGLIIKNKIEFPLNIQYYRRNRDIIFKKKVNEIPKKKIMEKIISNKELLFYEKLLFPKLEF